MATKTNKTFHIDRITEVAFCAKSFAFEALHKQQIPDAFGFSARADDKKFPVDVSFSLKGYQLLKNEYPMLLPYIKHNAQQNTYALKMEVNDLTPVQRFLKGLGGSDLLEKYLMRFINIVYIFGIKTKVSDIITTTKFVTLLKQKMNGNIKKT